MNNRFISIIILLGITIVASAAQENYTAKLNNISEKNGTSDNGTFNNSSINPSNIDNKSINETNFDQADASNGDVFIITGNATARPMNGIGFKISAESSVVPPIKRAIFLIKGYTRPTAGTIYENTSLLNAAYLSRGVEGTPHGYTTFYN
ncbi:MAG: hypothetical protein ACE14P_00045 [Methanotrichaceae archaeon]